MFKQLYNLRQLSGSWNNKFGFFTVLSNNQRYTVETTGNLLSQKKPTKVTPNCGQILNISHGLLLLFFELKIWGLGCKNGEGINHQLPVTGSKSSDSLTIPLFPTLSSSVPFQHSKQNGYLHIVWGKCRILFFKSAM